MQTSRLGATDSLLLPAIAAGRRLPMPEVHAHVTIHCHGLRGVLVRLLTSVLPTVEPPKAEVAMGDKRAHAERLSQREGLPVVALRSLGIRRLAVSGDLAEKVKSMGLVPAFSALAGKLQSSFRGRRRSFNAGSKQGRFAQLHANQRTEEP